MLDWLLDRLGPWEHESGHMLASLAQLCLIHTRRLGEFDNLVDRMLASSLPDPAALGLLARSLLLRGATERAQRLLTEAQRLRRLERSTSLLQRASRLESLATTALWRGQMEERERLLRRALLWARWTSPGDAGHLEEQLAEAQSPAALASSVP